MRIFNEEKTQELFDVDCERGYLYPGKILKEHHEEISEKVIKTEEEVKAELEAQGKEVLQGYDGRWYLTLEYSPATEQRREGRTVRAVEPVVEPGVPAWDEYEEIEVYHPFTEEEYLDHLRAQRERICFPVINRGELWYSRLTEEQRAELEAWYQAWLDVTETKVIPETPDWI